MSGGKTVMIWMYDLLGVGIVPIKTRTELKQKCNQAILKMVEKCKEKQTP